MAALFRRDDRSDARCVVVDTETSGLDPQQDVLLAIGAVAIDDTGIDVDDSFEVVVRPAERVSRENVVVHGIGDASQRAGVPPREALAAFVSYVAGAPLVAFHASFDRAVLARALADTDLRTAPLQWLDAAHLAATLFPEEHKRGRRALDDWLVHFAIDVSARHSAAGDALATAELVLRLRALAAAQGYRSHASLARFAQGYRWL
jgi:DNA polymerase-3 subunit epsilon